ncbi:ParA family protein [Roseinatronobacter monicus]|uniref:Chromosome partitioning protein n=1 Tax=Roseinatronobacter monicus TaxID=393481 RepID=A0A543K3E2_9RHOB|nr:ParA family protein [Roseinatronobacter monicus]TQM89598.1 chromosome partitioning protein [Roseinatronobacter monicus]
MAEQTADPIVLAVIGIKGGSGKTTLCSALASAITDMGKSVLLIDTDDQRSLSGWAQDAEAAGNGSEFMTCKVAPDSDHLDAAIDDAFRRQSVDFIIIDTAGVGGRQADEIAVQANLIVTPCMLTGHNYRSTTKTVAWYDKLTARVDDASALARLFVIINKVATHEGGLKLGPTERQIFQDAKASFPLFPYFLKERKVYTNMEVSGLLRPVANRLAASPNGLKRGQAAPYEAALDEAKFLFVELLKRGLSDEDGEESAA